jgi:hypothetical protein
MGLYSVLSACVGSVEARTPLRNHPCVRIEIINTPLSTPLISSSCNSTNRTQSRRCRNADRSLDYGAACHHRGHLGPVCAERRANPDLACPPRHGIGSHTVEPNGCEQESECSEPRLAARPSVRAHAAAALATLVPFRVHDKLAGVANPLSLPTSSIRLRNGRGAANRHAGICRAPG